ncbi:hypothetical protein Fuma_00279 [Fuerstiella marisgermanici]|uniref:Uncharacterized protein n=1 Tax=Fuerstiella marisgermanici TaxID=1891926 RepID=A0A1P8W9F8_9PLAN|nr:hypothetical protein Fuma_00279 [Fuerstiella marisgermanici]
MDEQRDADSVVVSEILSKRDSYMDMCGRLSGGELPRLRFRSPVEFSNPPV